MHLSLVTIVVNDYDQAVEFFTSVLGFELAEVARLRDIAGNKWDLIGPT